MPTLNLNIGARLILGFSILCLLLAAVVGITIVKVRTVNDSTARNVNLRVPTAMAAGDLVSGVYATLAALRGWLVTGSDGFKAERAVFWKEIQRRGSDMDRLSTRMEQREEQVGLEAGQAPARRIAQRAGQGRGDRPHHR